MTGVHEGGCLCRAIRYRVTGSPLRVSACYCTFCQRRTGGALSVHAFFDEQNIELIGDGLTHTNITPTKAVSGCGYTPANGARQR
jgi:hypothetical protein